MAGRRMLATGVASVLALAALLGGATPVDATLAAAASDRCRVAQAGANLSGCVITGRDLFNANLNGANLTNAVLRNVDLGQASLNRANLAGARLINTNLRSAFLQDAILTGASFESTSATPPTCRNEGNPFHGTNFRGARMSRVDFEFPVAGANFTMADLSNSALPCLTGVTAELANMRATTLSEVHNSDFSRADFTGTSLRGSGFINSDLTAANFTSARVSVAPSYYGPEGPQDRALGVIDRMCEFGCGDADRQTGQFDERRFYARYQCSFCESNLTGVRFNNAIFTGAVFRHVNLNLAQGVNISLRTRTDVLNEHVNNTPANVFERTVLHYDDSVLGLGHRTGTGAGINVRPNGYVIDNGLLLGPGVNLQGLDLHGRSFLPGTLRGARLVNADLRNTRITGSLAGARIDGVKLAGANLTGVSSGGVRGAAATLPVGWRATSGFLLGPGASFRNANMRGVNFGAANVRGADFTGADLGSAQLGAAVIDGAKVSGLGSGVPRTLPAGFIFRRVQACLLANQTVPSCHTLIGPGVNLTKANLSLVDFTGSVLRGANLTGADVTRADFARATPDGVISSGLVGTPTRLPVPWRLAGGALLGPGAVAQRVNLEGAQLAGANLAGADLRNSRLDGANLSGAILVRTDLREAGLNSTNLRGADLTLANTRGAVAIAADLRGAKVAGADLGLLPGTFFQASEADPAGFKVGDQGVIGTPRKLPENYRKVGPYLIGPFADIRGADLRGLDLRTTNVFGFYSVKSGRNASGPIVANGQTRTTQIPVGYKFVNRVLVGPQLNLVGADLSQADLSGVSFKGARLRGANLRLADLRRADLTGASGGGAFPRPDAQGGQVSEQPIPLSGLPLLLPAGWTIASTPAGSALISVPQAPRAAAATVTPASRAIAVRLSLNCAAITPSTPQPSQQVLCSPGEGGSPATEVVFKAIPLSGPTVTARCPVMSPGGPTVASRVAQCRIGVVKPGVSYRVEARVVNSVGDGPASTLAQSVIAAP